MSTSFYRGKLSTNETIKGSFTEAKDDFSVGFDVLTEQLKEKAKVTVYARPLEPAKITEIMFSIGGVFVLINRDGLVEIGENTT